MIKINLLPLDKRKTERTPLKGAGLMMADAAIAGAFIIAAIISWIQVLNTEAQVEAKKKTLDSLQEDVKKHDRLLAQSQQLQRDADDLARVTGMRPFEWSEIFDKIWDAIEKHKRVWVDSMEMADGKQMDSKIKALDPKTTVSGAKYGVVLKCHVGGIDVKAMTAFRRELKDDPTLSRYFPIVNFDTQWTVAEQKEFVEKFSLDFEVILVNTGQTKLNTTATPVKRTSP